MCDSPRRSLFDVCSEADDTHSISTAATSVHRCSLSTLAAEELRKDQSYRTQTTLGRPSDRTLPSNAQQNKKLPMIPSTNSRASSLWEDEELYWQLFPSPPANLPYRSLDCPKNGASIPSAQQSDDGNDVEAAWDDSASCVDQMIFSSPSPREDEPETQQTVVDDLRRQIARLQLALDLQAVRAPHHVHDSQCECGGVSDPSLARSSNSTMPTRQAESSLLFSSLSFISSSASSSSSTSSSNSTLKARQIPNIDTGHHARHVYSYGRPECGIQPRPCSSKPGDAQSHRSEKRLVQETSTPLAEDYVLLSSPPSSSKGRTAMTRFVSALKASPPDSNTHTPEVDIQLARVSWSHKHTGKMQVPKGNKLRQGPGRGRTLVKSPPPTATSFGALRG